MFYSNYSAENRPRFMNRWEWPWRTHTTTACLNCRKHIVTGGLVWCPTCGCKLYTVPNMPRKAARRWANVTAYLRRPPSQEQPLHPAPMPRRFPGNGRPKY